MYVIVVLALIPGLYALLINIDKHVINKTLFVVGSLILIGVLYGIIYSLIKINKNLKQLEEKSINHV